MGLKLPPGLVEDQTKAASNTTVPPVAVQPIPPMVIDKSLVIVKRNNMADKPRLGRELDAGIASWYGPRFDGRPTANGERFDRYALTAAHKTLPLGTRVVVSNPRTGKQIVVRINDRGPYFGKRILDLSEAAASALGLKARGHDWVVMNAILPPSDTPAAVVHTATAAAPASAPDSPESDAAAANVAPDMSVDRPMTEQAALLADPQAVEPTNTASTVSPAAVFEKMGADSQSPPVRQENAE
jgi:rare lipoprotein A